VRQEVPEALSIAKNTTYPTADIHVPVSIFSLFSKVEDDAFIASVPVVALLAFARPVYFLCHEGILKTLRISLAAWAGRATVRRQGEDVVVVAELVRIFVLWLMTLLADAATILRGR